MQYFSEATDILQAEEMPTSNHVISIVNSLENALMQSRSDTASIHALFQRLLTSLRGRFGYLLDSSIHKAATAIDPRVKLSFTDHHKEGKVFIFSSHDVKESIKCLIHLCPQVVSTTIEQPVLAKKAKLLDFSSIYEHSYSGTMNDVEIELQVYLDQSRVDINPIKFWAERKLLSVPCSSDPVVLASWYCSESTPYTNFKFKTGKTHFSLIILNITDLLYCDCMMYAGI